jgi:hypothetical protein
MLRTGSLCLFFAALAVYPAAAAESTNVERRIEALEHELEELKREVAKEDAEPPGGDYPAEGEEPQSPPPSKSSARSPLSLPTWHVTPDITFKPGFRVQARYRRNDDIGDNFFIRRFRIKGSGKAFMAKYGLELKVDNTWRRILDGDTGLVEIIHSPTPVVENAWVQFPLKPELNLRVGLYDAPFSRVALTSDSKLLLMDRGLIKDELSAEGFEDNTIGVLFHGRPMGGHLEYGLGVFQNRAFGKVPMPVARFAVNLLDPAPSGGYADERGSYLDEGRRLAIGANMAYTPDAREDGAEVDLYGWGTDLFLGIGPYSLQAEYVWFRKDIEAGPALTTQGGYVQGGYKLEWLDDLAPKGWRLPLFELTARYQDVDDDGDRSRSTSVGSNTYIRGHNLKVQTDYSFRSPDPDEFQLQLQLDF